MGLKRVCQTANFPHPDQQVTVVSRGQRNDGLRTAKINVYFSRGHLREYSVTLGLSSALTPTGGVIMRLLAIAGVFIFGCGAQELVVDWSSRSVIGCPTTA